MVPHALEEIIFFDQSSVILNHAQNQLLTIFFLGSNLRHLCKARAEFFLIICPSYWDYNSMGFQSRIIGSSLYFIYFFFIIYSFIFSDFSLWVFWFYIFFSSIQTDIQPCTTALFSTPKFLPFICGSLIHNGFACDV